MNTNPVGLALPAPKPESGSGSPNRQNLHTTGRVKQSVLTGMTYVPDTLMNLSTLGAPPERILTVRFADKTRCDRSPGLLLPQGSS